MGEYSQPDLPIVQALRKKGYKATPQRIAISRFAVRNRDHPSARKIYEEVKSLFPTVSIATVYKTLQTLSKLGLIQELTFQEGQARFDSYTKPHINLVCTQCGTIQDLDDRSAEEMVQRATSRSKFTATGQRLDVYGICEKCRRKEAQLREERSLPDAEEPLRVH